jgi:hypothetical protein
VKQLKDSASKQLGDLGAALHFVYCVVFAMVSTIEPVVWPIYMLRKHQLSPAPSCYGSTQRPHPLKWNKRKELA